MNRRRLLALLGASALPMAGCLGTDETPGTPTNDTPTTDHQSTPTQREVEPTEETVVSPPALGVENVGTRRQALTSGAHLDVYAAEAVQFVTFDVTGTDGDATLRTFLGPHFAVELDGTRHPTGGYDSVANAFGDVPRVGVPVPADTAPESGAIVQIDEDTEVDRWSLSEDVVAALATPAEFVVEAVDVPETVAPASFEASVTVRNEGDGDGIFVAEFGPAVASDVDEIEFAVRAGEAVTYTETFATEDVESIEGDSLPVVFDDGYSRIRREVTIKSSG